MNTENNQPKWIAEVLRIVNDVQENAKRAVEKFNGVAVQSGLAYAIEWRSHDVAATAGLEQEVSWVANIFTSEKFLADVEATAVMALKEIESRKQMFFSVFRVGASTSAFANAVENAKLEARAAAFQPFAGVYTQITHVITHRAAK